MTISSDLNKSGPYTANGATTVFARGFRADKETHLRVIQTIDGAETELVTGFIHGGIGLDSGDVTFSVAPVEGTITLLRAIPLTQETDYSAQGKVSPEQVEDDFDLQEMKMQDIKELVDRSFKSPLGGRTFTENNLPKYDASGNLIDSGTDGDILLQASLDAIDAAQRAESASSTISIANVVGDGTANPITLSLYPQTINNVFVHIDGVYQNAGAFTLAGNQLTPSAAIPLGAAVEVRMIAVNISEPSATFGTYAAFQASPDLLDGYFYRVTAGANGEVEDYQYLATGGPAAYGTLVLPVTAGGVGVSTRTVYAGYAEFEADPRPMLGAELLVPNVGRYTGVLSGGNVPNRADRMALELPWGGFAAEQFGVLLDGTECSEAFQSAVNAATGLNVTLHLPSGTIALGTKITTTGFLTLRGGGGIEIVPAGADVDFMDVGAGLDIEGVKIDGFTDHLKFSGSGDVRIVGNEFGNGEYFILGNIDTVDVVISDNNLHDFNKGLILESATVITGVSRFERNTVTNVARYVYRLQHDAPLYFQDNVIINVNDGGFTGTSSVARIVMRGSQTVNYIRGNVIKDVVCADADSVLLYWSGGNVIITGNTFGRFSSGDDCYLVKEKSTLCVGLLLADNLFLGGDDAAEWNALSYFLTDVGTTDASRKISGNTFHHLIGAIAVFFGQSALIIPGNTTIEDNTVFEMSGPCFVGSVNGCIGVTVRGNRCFKHNNKFHQALTGTQRQKSIFTHTGTASYGKAASVSVEDNDWLFSDAGETLGPYQRGFVATSLSNVDASADIRLIGNAAKGAEGYVHCTGSAGSALVYAKNNTALGGLSAAIDGKAGTTLGRGLVELQTDGNASEDGLAYTPDDQQPAIADAAAAPTQAEFNAVLAALRANNIIAT